MAKELLIMRHAKSSWKDESLADHDRPLNKRGLKDAPAMAGLLVGRQLQPDLILTSSALRAKSTAELIAGNINDPIPEIEVIPDFYLAPPGVYIEHLERLADQFQRPMVIGHNPGLEHLVSSFASSWQIMPTAAIAHILLDIESWSSLKSASVQSALQDVFRPKEVF